MISFWKPYHSSINVHNNFLKLYYGTFVLFMTICYIFSKSTQLSTNICITLIYIVMILIGIIMVGGFVRLVF